MENKDSRLRWPDVPAGLLHAAGHLLWNALGDHAGAFARQITKEPGYTSSVAQMLREGCVPSLSQQSAKKIMGKHFFGTEDSSKFFRIDFTPRQREFMHVLPFSEDVLVKYKDTHLLVAYPLVSISGLRAQVNESRYCSQVHVFHPQSWDDQTSWFADIGHFEWHLIRKTPVPDSMSLDFPTQRSLAVRDSGVIPSCRVLVYAVVGHFLKTGERLFADCRVRTSTRSDADHLITVGWVPGGGLALDPWHDTEAKEFIGVSREETRLLI